MPVCQFFRHIANHVRFFFGIEVAHHSSKCDPDYVAVVHPGSKVLTHFEPHVVEGVDVFRPQSWRMRAKVDKYRWPVRGDDFQRTGEPGFGKSLPCFSDTLREFVGMHSG